jgi:hypothetical protein
VQNRARSCCAVACSEMGAETSTERRDVPHGVQKRGSKYAIVDKRTGKTKGKSDTKKKAQASARIRDQRAKD